MVFMRARKAIFSRQRIIAPAGRRPGKQRVVEPDLLTTEPALVVHVADGEVEAVVALGAEMLDDVGE
jgi:hypothetical protein